MAYTLTLDPGLGTVSFPSLPAGVTATYDNATGAEIVIFPGVRIERHDLDLAHRVRETVEPGYNGLGGNGRPRKTS